MNNYEVLIEDIYDRGKTKKVSVNDINVYMAHKKALYQTNALREEISKIYNEGRTVYTFNGGFTEE